MARVRIVACDGTHGEELHPAVGRIGVQEGDKPVAWKDFCATCLEATTKRLPALGMNLNGTPRRTKPIKAKVKVKAHRKAATRPTPAAGGELSEKLEALLRKAGPMSGPELMDALHVTKSVLYRRLRYLDAVKEGDKRAARWSLRKAG